MSAISGQPVMPYPFNVAPPVPPASGFQSTYLEFVAAEQGEFDTFYEATRAAQQPAELGRQTEEPSFFTCEDSSAVYSERHRRFFLTARKPGTGAVKYRQLSRVDQALFDIARANEINKLIACGAMRKLSVRESRAFIDKYGMQYVLGSQFVEKWKVQDDGSVIPSLDTV